MTDRKVTITLQTLHRLAHAVSMFVKSSVGAKAKLMIAALFILLLAINGMNVINSYVGRHFMTSIERRDMSAFVYFAWLYAGVFGLSTVTAVIFRFTEERLGLLWRGWMTNRIVGMYLHRGLYLRLSSSGEVTNPDQRIAEDVRSLTVTTLSFLLMFLNSTITVVSFAGVLWSISPTLFFVSVLYAAVGSALTVFLGQPLMKLNYKQADFEADFRTALIRVREDAENIAKRGEEQQVRSEITQKFERLVENLRHIIGINRNLGFFTTGYNYMIQLIPILFVAPIFIEHGVEFGIIGQSAMAFATMVGAFSLIVTQYNSISAYASVVTRLGEFVEAFERQSEE